MSWIGKPGKPGRIETTEEILLRKIKNKSESTRYNFTGERFESILLRHLSEEENQECCKGME